MRSRVYVDNFEKNKYDFGSLESIIELQVTYGT